MSLALITLLLGAIVILLGVLVAVFMKKKGKSSKTREINYESFFIMGISFFPLGLILSVAVSPGFFAITALGIIYMLIGFTNKGKWDSQRAERRAKKVNKKK